MQAVLRAPTSSPRSICGAVGISFCRRSTRLSAFTHNRSTEFANLYFQAGKFIYMAAALLAGWGIAILAARQRLKATWPITAMLLIAWMGGTAQNPGKPRRNPRTWAYQHSLLRLRGVKPSGL
jgi:hypothetical protein